MIDEKLLIFGAGSHARKLAVSLCNKGGGVHGFVTTRQSPLHEVDGLPVYTWETIPGHLRGECPIACGIFNRSDAYDKLNEIITANGFRRIIWPWDYYPYLHHDLGWCYWLDPKPRLLPLWEGSEDYHKLISILADSESKQILERVIAFRAGLDIRFASYISSDDQYFNTLSLNALPANRSITFLDVGAYNGDTLESLVNHVHVSNSVLIEPDQTNFKLLIEKLPRLVRQHPGLRPLALPMGAGDLLGSMWLSGEGEAAAVSGGVSADDGASRFTTIAPLDSIMPAETFDFIKVDVEGHDLEVLRGMQSILCRSHAVIAISLYHRPLDLVHLPLAMLELLDSLPYKYFIRQHMYNSFDTVLYAIPVREKS